MKHCDTKLILLGMLEAATILESAVWGMEIMLPLIMLPVLLITTLHIKSKPKKLTKPV